MNRKTFFFWSACVFSVFCGANAADTANEKTAKNDHLVAVFDLAQRTVPYAVIDTDAQTHLEWAKKSTERIKKMTPFEKRSVAITFFSQNQPLHDWANTFFPVTLQYQAWQDLELFTTRSWVAGEHITGTLDRSMLECGAVAQRVLLAVPGSTLSEVQERQDAVQTFIENKNLHTRYKELALTIKEHENVLLRSCESYDRMAVGIDKRNNFYTPLTKWLNKYSSMLFARTWYYRAYEVVDITCFTLFVAAWAAYTGYVIKNGLDENGNIRGGGRFLTHRMIGAVEGNARNSTNWDLRLFWNKSKNPYFRSTLAGLAAYFWFFALKDRYENLQSRLLFEKALQTCLSSIAQVVRSARQIADEIKRQPALATRPELQPLISFFEKDCVEDAQLKELLSLLNETTFDRSTFFAHVGRVVRAYHLWMANKEKFFPMLASLGFLDAYASIATLYNEHQDTPVQFCLPRFIEQTAPAITLNGVWHPFVAADTAIPNDFMLGSLPAHREAIITGPNTAGKSTLLKSVALSALMAQGWGIAPASAITMTPFSIIETYLNISDDTAEGNSLFKQEVIRANQLLQRIKGLPAGQHALVFFDEMYSGTSPKESVACAYSTAQHLAQQEQALSMVATHFELLTELPQYFPHAGNYRMTVQRTRGGGQFRCPFKVEPGVSHDHVALDVLAQEGVDADILQTAREVLARE